MASFADLVAKRIQQRQQEFVAAFSPDPHSTHERALATGIQDAWHPLLRDPIESRSGSALDMSAAAVDGSRATRAMNSGADWVIAQAHLVGQDGLRLSAADTILVRGEVERPAVDRCASLLMRSLELELALKYAQSGAGRLLLLDGSLYADLPHLLYNLAIPGLGDLPLVVLRQYLDLFTYCQKHDILLLGLAKSTRSTVLARAILDQHALVDGSLPDAADVVDVSAAANAAQETASADALVAMSASAELPTDGEILHRWAKGVGYSTPILLGTVSFGHRRASVLDQPTAVADQFTDGQLSRTERRDVVRRLRQTPAIGSFYIRLAAGDDALRVDALASTFGRDDCSLLDFAYQMVPHETAMPVARLLQRDYGGASVYNAALFVVDREVRLSAQTVDHVYLSILRRELDAHVQYDRSTRRFSS